MSNTRLEETIHQTISYFDVFSYPLTELEIHKWLWKEKIEYKRVVNELQNLVDKKTIAYKDGLYFLPSKENLVVERRRKYIEAEKKYTKVKRIAKILQIIPFIRFIGVCNTLPILDFNEKSDIDLFIIVKKNRMWTTRFLTTALTAATGEWRHGENVKDKLCLSFYVTTERLNLESISIEPEDPYLIYWINFLTPILDRNTYLDFWEENNWIKKYTPNTHPQNMLSKRRKIEENKFLNAIRRGIEKILWKKFGAFIEKKLRNWQLAKIQKKESTRKTPTHILFTDAILKFHELDRRKEYREEWIRKIADNPQKEGI